MRFFQPEYCLLLLLVPLIALFLIWAWRRRLRDREIFMRGMNLEALAPKVASGKVTLKAVFLLAALSLGFIALGRPQWGTHQERVKRQGMDVMVVLDVSRSMDVQDESLGRFSRLEKAKLEINRLVRRLPEDRLGLVLFDRDAFIHCPLTLDHSAFNLYLDVVEADLMPAEGQGTSIAKSIDVALRGFDPESEQAKVIALFSDGETFDEDLSDVIDKAEEMKVKIFAVGVGSQRGGLIPIKNRAGEVVDYVKDEDGTDALSKLSTQALERLAYGTGGKAYQASSGGRVLNSLVEDITGFEKAELEGKLITQYEDRFQIPLFAALIFLIFEFLLSDLKGIYWRRIFAG